MIVKKNYSERYDQEVLYINYVVDTLVTLLMNKYNEKPKYFA